MPVLRALVLLDREDPNAWAADTQYLLGPDLLVCPITAAGLDHMRVYLPPGRWYDYWSGEAFEGGMWMTVPVTLERLPLFVRGGAVLPLGPEEDWVGQHASEPLTPLVFPDADGHAQSVLRHADGTSTYTYRDGRLAISDGGPPRP